MGGGGQEEIEVQRERSKALESCSGRWLRSLEGSGMWRSCA